MKIINIGHLNSLYFLAETLDSWGHMVLMPPPRADSMSKYDYYLCTCARTWFQTTWCLLREWIRCQNLMSVQKLCIKPPDASSESNRPQLIPDVRSGHAVKSFETILNVKSLWSVPIFTSLQNENLELFRHSNLFSLSLCIRHVYEHSFLWMTFLTLHYASASVLGNSNLGPALEVQSLKIQFFWLHILGYFFISFCFAFLFCFTVSLLFPVLLS